MAILCALYHLTHYKYDRPIALGPQTIRLRPAPHSRTRIPNYSLKVAPANHFINWQQDPHGNWLARIVFPEKTDELKIEVDLTAEMAVINPFDFFVEPYAEHFPFEYTPDLREELQPYLQTEPVGDAFEAYLAANQPPAGARTTDFLVGLNAKLAQDIAYTIRMEPGVQTPDETLTLRSGSCRDTTWLLVQILRRMGLAARFVSGYLIQLKADIDPVSGAQGTRTDFTDLHAWVEAYIPGAGWIGMDATSGLLCAEGHIPLCATPHYKSAAPISGVAEPAGVEFGFEMRVDRIREAPRITLPFSDEAWQRLDALGEVVDRDLATQDVRLTMGGEPTFVSIDDFESAEWNTAASGPTKRILADKLIRRLRDTFGPGGFLHYGQGKWYPGEVLPRWAFGLYWRKDGKPIWKDEALMPPLERGEAPSVEAAKAYAGAVAERLGIPADYALPTYEDTAQALMREGELPGNVDPGNPKIDDPEERLRLVRAFERGLAKPAAYVLPIQAWEPDMPRGTRTGRWMSERWHVRRGKIFLVPGDSRRAFACP